MKIKVINGPNLNLLGTREPAIYGKETYKDLINTLTEFASTHHVDIDCFQSNHEGEIIDAIQEVYLKHYDALIINPGAYTHYSYAIRDALAILTCIKVEVHLSDIYNREDFRKTNVIKEVIHHSVIGKGMAGYIEALHYIIDK